jgi:hypothetical protein
MYYVNTPPLSQQIQYSVCLQEVLIVGMIDSIGGPDRLNNFLSTLNLKPINPKSLKKMERRAGVYVEAVAKSSTQKAATDAFEMEMK